MHPNGFSSPVVQVLIQLLSSPAELWELRTKSYLGKLPCRQTAHWDFVSTTSQPRVSPAWSKGAALHDRVNKAKSQAWWWGRTVFSSDSVATNPWLPSGLVQAFAPMSSCKCCCSMVLWLEFCEEETQTLCAVLYLWNKHICWLQVVFLLLLTFQPTVKTEILNDETCLNLWTPSTLYYFRFRQILFLPVIIMAAGVNIYLEQIMCACVCLCLCVFICVRHSQRREKKQRRWRKSASKQAAVAMVSVIFHRFLTFLLYFLSLNQTTQLLCC